MQAANGLPFVQLSSLCGQLCRGLTGAIACDMGIFLFGHGEIKGRFTHHCSGRQVLSHSLDLNVASVKASMGKIAGWNDRDLACTRFDQKLDADIFLFYSIS